MECGLSNRLIDQCQENQCLVTYFNKLLSWVEKKSNAEGNNHANYAIHHEILLLRNSHLIDYVPR